MQDISTINMRNLYCISGLIAVCSLIIVTYYGLYDETGQEWAFMRYFDDQFNFLDFPHLNSLTSENLLSHFYAIISHRGLNVYEPVSSFLKAFIVDMVGLNPFRLRVVSLFIHVLNSSLLLCWLHLVLLNSDVQVSGWLIVCEVIAVSIFAVHPLNVEVVGWLSAHGYLFSLFFTLLSCIFYEYAWYKGSTAPPSVTVQRKVNSSKKMEADKSAEEKTEKPVPSPADEQLLDSVSHLFAGSLVCYAAAVMCKAPAIMLAVVLTLRYLLQRLGNLQTLLHSSISIMFLLYLTVLWVLAGVLVQMVLSANETGSNMSSLQVVYNLFTSDKVLLRSLYTLSMFAARFFFPLDLRSHYTPPFAGDYFTWSNLRSDPTLHLPILLFLAGCLLVLVQSLHCTTINAGDTSGGSPAGKSSSLVWRAPPLLLLWSLLSYGLFWLPGVGIIEHGWSQLGADRYNYFPLAFACPALAYGLHSMGAAAFASSSVSISDGKASKPKKLQHEGDSHSLFMIYRVILCLLSVCLLGSLSQLSARHLKTWRNDKVMLENCIKVDPKDWECNQYLGEWYGFYENNPELGNHYNTLAIENIPTHSPKNLMFKARLLLSRDNAAACESVRAAHSLIVKVNPRGEYEVDTKNYDYYKVYPMIINNLATCDMLHNGITMPIALAALKALKQVQQTIIDHPPKILTTEWKSVQEKLESQIASLTLWTKDPQKEYQAVFLW